MTGSGKLDGAGEGLPPPMADAPVGWRTRALDRSELVRSSQARVLETAARLIAAARSLYVQNAGHDFTVQEIANTAGVSLQTFYRHFKSKDDLMLAVYESTVQESVDALRATYGSVEDPIERLREYTVGGLRRGFRARTGVHIWMVNTERVRLSQTFPTEVVAAYRPYQNLVAECIEQGVAREDFRLEPPVTETARVVATLISGLYRDLGNSAPHADTEAMLDAAWTFILAGLGVGTASERYGLAPRPKHPTTRQAPRD